MAEFVSHEDARKMIRKHMQNLKALAACKRHDFRNEAEGEGAGGRFSCTACGGVVTDDQRRWYEQGVEHGRQAGVVKKKT